MDDRVDVPAGPVIALERRGGQSGARTGRGLGHRDV